LYLVYRLQQLVYRLHQLVYRLQQLVYSLQQLVYRLKNLYYRLQHLVYSLHKLVFRLQQLVYRLQHLVYRLQQLVYRLQQLVYRLQQLVYSSVIELFPRTKLQILFHNFTPRYIPTSHIYSELTVSSEYATRTQWREVRRMCRAALSRGHVFQELLIAAEGPRA
jgi:hypothetical protein